MATVDQRAMSVTFGFLDQERSRSRMRIHMTNPLFLNNPTFGAPVYMAYVRGGLTTAVQALSDSPIETSSTLIKAVTSPRPTVGAGEAEKKGVFLFGDVNGGKLFRMAIPGIKESVLAANKRDIDLSNTLVAAFLTAMTSGDIIPVTENSIALSGVGVSDAYKFHRRSHRGRSRRTG
jgi:hypothetical protein